MNRRDFLYSLAAIPFLSSCKSEKSAFKFSGQFIGPDIANGHRLRGNDFPQYSNTKKIKVAIIGAGVSGLTAGWNLHRNDISDYRIFELENTIGGNSRSGKNQTSAFPWGAHYLPIPNESALVLKTFLAESGAIVANYDGAKPTYNDRFLCFTPEERLYINGTWQDGLSPSAGVSMNEKAELKRFEDLIERFKQAKGSDGKYAFTIPIANCSTAPEFLILDRLSISDYLKQEGFTSTALHWYVNYACRDDYGTHHQQISAWAGIHYFASRRGLAKNADADQVLTWPEGNAWLSNKLAEPQLANIEAQALVYSISSERHHVCIDVFSTTNQSTTRWLADQVIFASPLHVLPHVLKDKQEDLIAAAKKTPHAPWMVANLSINGWPEESANIGLAWDNVFYDSPSLGYVSARHQNLDRYIENNVITYYQPMAMNDDSSARRILKETSWQQWVNKIVKDLSKPHPNMSSHIENIDIFRWAHAMTYPYTGFLSAQQRTIFNQPHGRIQFAHTDAAGISIFEEAFEQGVRASNHILGVKT